MCTAFAVALALTQCVLFFYTLDIFADPLDLTIMLPFRRHRPMASLNQLSHFICIFPFSWLWCVRVVDTWKHTLPPGRVHKIEKFFSSAFSYVVGMNLKPFLFFSVGLEWNAVKLREIKALWNLIGVYFAITVNRRIRVRSNTICIFNNNNNNVGKRTLGSMKNNNNNTAVNVRLTGCR